MAKTNSIPDKFEALVSVLKERYVAGEKKAYYISDLQKQNPDLNTKRIKEWAKQVTGMSATEYFTSIGLLAPYEYYPDDLFTEISLEQLEGKTFFVMSQSVPTRQDIAGMLQDYGGIEVPEYQESVDYVFVPKTTLRRAPAEQMPGLDELLRKIEAEGRLRGRFLYTYTLTEQYQDVVAHRQMSDEQRSALGVIFSKSYTPLSEPDTTVNCPEFKINCKIKEKDIPVYNPGTVYWSIEEFRDWFEAAGGEIRPGSTLKDYSIAGESYAESHRLQKAFERFALLCRSLDMPEVQAYLCRNAATTKNGELALNRVHRMASLGYIEDFDGCMTLVAKNTSRDTITVTLQKEAIARHYDDMDYTLDKNIVDGIPADLLKALIPPNLTACPRRGQPGYLFVDCADSQLPKRVFANDLAIKYIEFSDRITHTGYSAFVNCSNLEEVYFGNNTLTIGSGCFANCKNVKRIVIPDSVRELQGNCFEDCDSLEEIQFSKWSCCSKIGYKSFRNCKNLQRMVIPDLVEVIDSMAFENCEKLKSIDLPRGFARINNRAFAGCISLESVSCERCLREKVYIENDSFDGCSSLVLDKKLALEKQ